MSERTTSQIEIRPFLPTEVDAYYAIRLLALQSNPEAFITTADDFANRPRAMIASQLRQSHEAPRQSMLGAFDGARAVGMMGIIGNESGKRQHIAAIVAVFVDAAYRGRGLGGQLLDAALARASAMPGVEQLLLSVVGNNPAAERLYKSRGFQVYGIEPHALKHGDSYLDEILMVKFLEQTTV